MNTKQNYLCHEFGGDVVTVSLRPEVLGQLGALRPHLIHLSQNTANLERRITA